MGKALLYELGASTSFAQLCLKGKVLWPMLLAASDDQGRGLAEDKTVKWKVCPNVVEITVKDITDLLCEMQHEGMICLYCDDRGRSLYQITRWWEYQCMQWAQPSKYEPPEGWTDRVRVNRRDTGYAAKNWNTTGGFSAQPTESEPPDDENPDDSQGTLPGGNVGTDAGRDAGAVPIKDNLNKRNSSKEPPEGGGPPSTPAKKPRKRTSKPKEPSPAKQASQEMFGALAELCQIDWRACTREQRSALNQSEKLLRTKLNASPADLKEFPDWWYAYDWRGRGSKDRPPSPPRPHQVRETWGQFVTWRKNGRRAPRGHDATSPPPAPPPDPARVERDRADLRAHRARQQREAAADAG